MIKLSELHYNFLKKLYRSYFNGEDVSNYDKWTTEFKMEKTEITKILFQMKDEGLCEFPYMAPLCKISADGIIFSEDNGIIDESLIKKNRSIRTKILENIYNQMKENDLKSVWINKVFSETGLEEIEFTLNYRILEKIGYIVDNSANTISLTPYGMEVVEDYLERKELAEDYNELKNIKNPQKRGRELDKYISRLINRDGWETDSNVIGTGEENDIFIKKDLTIFLIQCKWENKPIQPKYIREFFGRMENRTHIEGIFISMSIFTENAINSIFDYLGKQIIIPFGPKDIEELVTQKYNFNGLLEEKRSLMLTKRQIVIDGEIFKK